MIDWHLVARWTVAFLVGVASCVLSKLSPDSAWMCGWYGALTFYVVVREDLATPWKHIKCALFGHDWRGEALGDIGAARDCAGCGKHWPAVVWPKGVSVNPAPSAQQPDTIKQALADLRTEREALEQRLYALIRNEVTAFFDRTGASVASIEVCVMELHELGAPKQRRVAYVSVATPLD
jgi:hypothetical protein